MNLLRDLEEMCEDRNYDEVEFEGKCLFSGEKYVLIEFPDGKELFLDKAHLFMWPGERATGAVKVKRAYLEDVIQKYYGEEADA